MSNHDVIVVGLGAMGSAVTCQLAMRGVDVLGIDRFAPPHGLGSSHGDTRITRLATAEGDEYVPLARRSQELWREFESLTGRELLVQCGGLIMGVPNSTSQHGVAGFADATRDVAARTGVVVEILDASMIEARFGVFTTSGEHGVFEPTAGYLHAAECIRAQLEIARIHGATCALDEHVTSWRSDGRTVRVDTTSGHHEAAQLVVASGPWVDELVPELAPLVTVQRQVQYWYAPDAMIDSYRRLPVFIWMHGTEPGQYFYGFPADAGGRPGVKVATEVAEVLASPDAVDRDVTADAIDAFHVRHLAGRFRGLTARCTSTAVCLYTVTPDFAFVIDRLPDTPNVLVVSPCSGHGFKHSAAIGESVADLAIGAEPEVDLSAFSLSRFS